MFLAHIQSMLQVGKNGTDIDYLLLTHLHSDHVIDFYQLIISSWHQYRKDKWKIIGPIGTKNFLNSFMSLWNEERQMRINYEKRNSIEAFNLDITEINEDGKINIGDIEVEFFKVDHRPINYAFGYNFKNKGKKITISGDTKPCDNLEKFGMNTDLLLHEVFIDYEIKPIHGMRSLETINNVKSYHTLSNEVGKIAKKVNAGSLILTHFVPPDFDKKLLIQNISKDYKKKIIVGEDLMTVDIQGNILKQKINI